eukprot:scaffold1928_cov381-Prasinococcus_capsulatus_cf.AAC.28
MSDSDTVGRARVKSRARNLHIRGVYVITTAGDTLSHKAPPPMRPRALKRFTVLTPAPASAPCAPRFAAKVAACAVIIKPAKTPHPSTMRMTNMMP